VSLDVLARWARPLYPDANLLPAAAAADAEPDYFSSQRCMCATTCPFPVVIWPTHVVLWSCRINALC
jgi:hypothetical protein